MFDRCEALANQWLLPIAAKLNDQVHLSSIKKTLMSLTPIFIIGSFSLIPTFIVNVLGETHGVSMWILSYADIIHLLYILSIGFISIYATIAMAYHLANAYDIDVVHVVVLSFLTLGISALQYISEGLIDQTMLGTQGLYFAILSAILTVELYRWTKAKHFVLKLPNSVPSFVSLSAEMIPVSILVIGFFIVLRMLSVTFLHIIPPLILSQFLLPIVGCLDNPFVYTGLKILQCFLFFFGIHPAVLDPVLKPVSYQFLTENITNYYAGIPAQHFFCPGPESAFGNFTGTGITIGFVVWCLFSHSEVLKKVGKTSLVPSLFGVNEPILFGAPIVLNPLFFIPFVIGGGIIGSLGGWAMYLGWMRCSFFTPPYFGLFIEAFLTNLDGISIVVNAVQLLLSILIWYPFVKIYEKKFDSTGFQDMISKEEEK